MADEYKEALDAFGQAWQRALGAVHVGAHCSCCGGGQPLMLSGSFLEDHVIGFLRPRYEKEGAQAMVALLDRRAAARQRSLIVWLGELAPHAGGAERMLLDDMSAIVGQIRGHR